MAQSFHPGGQPPAPTNHQLAAAINDMYQQLSRQLAILQRDLVSVRRTTTAIDLEKLLAAHGKERRMPVELRSQFGEDLLLHEVFRTQFDAGQFSGFFLEVGAFDGYNYSVTYFLECIGWDGLLIEAIPERARQCEQRRKHSKVVHAALGSHTSPKEMDLTITHDVFGGMLSYVHQDPLHVEAVKNAPKKVVRVPVTTIDALLENDPRRLDVAIIDVEGGELEVLAGFDLGKHKPRMLVLEDNSRDPHSALGKYMERQPYIFGGWVDVNRIYLHKDEHAIQKRMSG